MNPAILLIALPTDPQPPIVPVLDPPLAAFVAEDAPKPVMDKWTGSVAIGAVYQDGNTDARSVNATGKAEYRREKDRWTIDGFWDYGETKDQTTGDWALNSRKAGLAAKYDYFLSQKLYVSGNASADTDTLADIKLRTFFGASVGYQWQESETFKWNSEIGAGYLTEEHYVDDDKDYWAGRAMNNIEWQINDKCSFANTATVYMSLEDKEDVNTRSDTRLKTNLTDTMFAQLQWVWDYDNTPATDKERNDNKVSLGLGWSF